MRKTKRKGSKGRSIKRRSTKHGSTKGRTTKRSGAKRGGGNAPAKVFEDGGILFSNASVQRMLNDEDLYINRTTKKMSFQDFIDLLNKDIKKEHKKMMAVRLMMLLSEVQFFIHLLIKFMILHMKILKRLPM